MTTELKTDAKLFRRPDGNHQSVNHMQANTKRPHVFATASSAVHVWRLGAGLVETKGNDQEELRALDAIAMEAMTDEWPCHCDFIDYFHSKEY